MPVSLLNLCQQSVRLVVRSTSKRRSWLSLKASINPKPGFIVVSSESLKNIVTVTTQVERVRQNVLLLGMNVFIQDLTINEEA
jgi:hypothetical protein